MINHVWSIRRRESTTCGLSGSRTVGTLKCEGLVGTDEGILNAKRTIWNKRHLCQSGARICRKNVDDPRAKPNVAKAEAVFGRHDIAIAGGFRNTDELRAFASEVQLMDHVWAFRSYPALQDWTQKKADGHASNAYLLIRSNDTQKTMSELKKVPEIQEIIGTTGDSDIVARISADPRENLLESVVTKVQGMPGVLSTETLPAFSKY